MTTMDSKIRLERGCLMFLLFQLVICGLVAIVIVISVEQWFKAHWVLWAISGIEFKRNLVVLFSLKMVFGTLWYSHGALQRATLNPPYARTYSSMDNSADGLLFNWMGSTGGLFGLWFLWSKGLAWDVESAIYCASCWIAAMLVAREISRISEYIDDSE